MRNRKNAEEVKERLKSTLVDNIVNAEAYIRKLDKQIREMDELKPGDHSKLEWSNREQKPRLVMLVGNDYDENDSAREIGVDVDGTQLEARSKFIHMDNFMQNTEDEQFIELANKSFQRIEDEYKVEVADLGRPPDSARLEVIPAKEFMKQKNRLVIESYNAKDPRQKEQELVQEVDKIIHLYKHQGA